MKVQNGELLPLSGANKGKPALVQGQLTTGKVLEALPGNVAKLALGGEIRTALLETVLQAGESYWFEVRQTEPLALKKLEPITNKEKDAAAFVAARLGSTKEPAARMAAQFLFTSNLPATKDQLNSIAERFRISQHNEAETGEIITKMMKHDIPLTEGPFRVVESVNGTGTLRNELVKLRDEIGHQQPTRLLNELKQAINAVLQGSMEESTEKPITDILNALVKNKQQKTQELESILKKAGWLNESKPLGETKSGITPKSEGTDGNAWNPKLVLNQGISKEQTMTGLLKILSDLPEEEERHLVYSLFQSEKRNTRPPLSLMKQIEQIGLLHEARLLSTKLDEKAENQNVKSLLLQLLHSDEPITATAKTQAETVLNKITGLQLTMLQS
ncbi:hypothetical protein [Fictibacillus sp. NRS-1165]|uniref:hypothetical protein n=1 Tax=Fictibacillus sp. NRS-1165 TaxID=3144463 RepID=UPI003D1AEB7A